MWRCRREHQRSDLRGLAGPGHRTPASTRPTPRSPARGLNPAVDWIGTSADRAVQRVAETLAMNTRLVNGPIYRLLTTDIRGGHQLGGRSASTSSSTTRSRSTCSKANWWTPSPPARTPCRCVTATCRISASVLDVGEPPVRGRRPRAHRDRPAGRPVPRGRGLPAAGPGAVRPRAQRRSPARGDPEGLPPAAHRRSPRRAGRHRRSAARWKRSCSAARTSTTRWAIILSADPHASDAGSPSRCAG